MVSWERKIPWRKIWQPTPVLLPGKSHGQRIPVGYSPWSHKMVGQDLVTKQQQSYFHPYKEKNVTSVLRMSWVRSNLSPVFSVSCTCGRAPNSECRVCLKKWRVQPLGQTHLEYAITFNLEVGEWFVCCVHQSGAEFPSYLAQGGVQEGRVAHASNTRDSSDSFSMFP